MTAQQNEEDIMTGYSRRDFLKFTTSTLLTASGLLGLGSLLRFLHFQADSPPQTEFDLGEATNYAVGSRTLLPDVPALLIHSEHGFSAMSLVCPHLGCTIEPQADDLICPCHGSRYTPQGVVLRGPAKQALRSLRVETRDDGHLRLFTV